MGPWMALGEWSDVCFNYERRNTNLIFFQTLCNVVQVFLCWSSITPWKEGMGEKMSDFGFDYEYGDKFERYIGGGVERGRWYRLNGIPMSPFYERSEPAEADPTHRHRPDLFDIDSVGIFFFLLSF